MLFTHSAILLYFSFSILYSKYGSFASGCKLFFEHTILSSWLEISYYHYLLVRVFPLTVNLSDSKSSQVSRTIFSILAVLKNAVVWMVSTRLSTSKSSSPVNNPLVTAPKAPITIVTFMFQSFFNSLARSRYLSFFSHSFSFILWSARTAKSTILKNSIFFCWSLLGFVFWPILLLLLLLLLITF